MKISTILTYLFISAGLLFSTTVNSQEDVLQSSCDKYFTSPFIATGKPFRALLTGDENAEFKASFLAGTTYRMAVCSNEQNYVLFSIYDKDRNLLFTNANHENSPYWDFKVESSIDCIVEAKLDQTKSKSGFAMIMTGFKLEME